MTTNSSKPLAVLILLFFMWGFITCLNDILVPYLKNIFDLNIFQATLVQFAFFGAYFTGSLAYFLYSYFLGDPINQVGYKKGILFGLLLSAIGCLLFVPASILKMYGLFLFALFILGLGLTALQITANPLVTLIGNPHTASSRLNLAQAFNSFGTTIAPVLGGYFIFEYFAVNGTITA
ncbi:MAG: MFS transporter, partial [Cyclobacteriaceae bacterium]|nr:MFS transporter [Cyclobacteriaceae bacterium]